MDMERQESDRWVEDIFSSMEGSSRAIAPDHLLSKIQAKIEDTQPAKVRKLSLVYAVSAACVILLINMLAIHQISQSNNESELVTDSYSDNATQLISDFNIYE